MIAMLNSCSIVGIDAIAVKVEVDVSNGLPAFDIVGLPDTVVKESKERVRTAVRNAGFDFPLKRITVNLAPADVRKEGALFDLPIALGIILATEQIVARRDLTHLAFVGALSLDGQVQSINGVLSMGLLFEKSEIRELVVPLSNADEVALFDNLSIYGVSQLAEVVLWLSGREELAPTAPYDWQQPQQAVFGEADMAEIKGQEAVKRALEIAAAGGHNVIMIGPPGSGKTMIARRLPTIMPEMTLQESLETTRIYSVAAMLPAEVSLVRQRPFRAPHHGASAASIIGGGRIPKPGEISLAHNGVLFFDELPEFQRDVLEALRQPLEDKVVTVARVQARLDFPARFQFVAAMNPCPCGHLNDPFTPCRCTPAQRSRYLAKVSGPLLDRIDLHIQVQRVPYDDISGSRQSETSAEIKERVQAARAVQLQRFQGTALLTNSDMQHRHIEKYCHMTEDAQQLLAAAFVRMGLSARAHDRILKVARTIADLDGRAIIEQKHLAEAVQYRALDKRK